MNREIINPGSVPIPILIDQVLSFFHTEDSNKVRVNFLKGTEGGIAITPRFDIGTKFEDIDRRLWYPVVLKSTETQKILFIDGLQIRITK